MAKKDESFRFQPPDRNALGKKRWGWDLEATQDGEAWLQSQPFWNDLGRAEAIIRGKEMLKADENRSDLTSNRLKRIAREMVAAISDVRYPEDVWSSENKAYQNQLTMFSKASRGIWYEARAPYGVRRLSQWMLAGGTGNFWPVFRRRNPIDPFSTGLCFDDYGPRDVVPFMLDERNWQETYSVKMIKMVSLPKAHSLFPLFADKIRTVPKRRQESGVVTARMNLISSLKGTSGKNAGAESLVEIGYRLIRDISINDTGFAIPMGDAGASWSYVVPYMGQEIPSTDIKSGARYMRKAGIDDCRNYPNMRLMVTCSGVEEPVYDGPAWDWHGMMPPRFSADDWVTEQMGFSIFRDVFDLERARQFTERAIDMKIKAQMDPGMKYDNTAINAGTAEEIDPWEMRKRLGVDGEVDKVIDTILPHAFYQIGGDPPAWIEYLEKQQDYYTGTNQLSKLAEAKMSTGQEGADDLLRMAGPIVRDICFGMETPMADVLEMQKYQLLQFFDTARIMNFVGPDGVTPETFDFDPNKLTPATMPGEDPTKPSQFSRMERAKSFARNLTLTPTPGYLHGIPQTAQKLLLLQGSRAGLPISPRRILRQVFAIENVDQEIKEFQDFREWQLELESKAKQEASSLPGADQGGGGASVSKKKPGRPPSGKKPPTAQTKGSSEGPRATVTES